MPTVDRRATARRDPASTAAPCPGHRLLQHLMSKWGVLVITRLADGTMCWAELRRSIVGISEKMLIQTLRELEDDGLVLREAHPEVPPRVEYSLTTKGQEAAALIQPLLDWIDEATGTDCAGRRLT